MVCFKNPSPKGGGFLFVGIRKKDGTGQVGFCLEKGCMTPTTMGENPDKIQHQRKTRLLWGELQTKFKTPDGWFTRCYKMWITCGKLFCGGGCG